ncbi:hypothetical protein KC345_g228 [Hortaea werneckii]|nr:hypothetical protein KC345_g228 [Hortaea werneckii]
MGDSKNPNHHCKPEHSGTSGCDFKPKKQLWIEESRKSEYCGDGPADESNEAARLSALEQVLKLVDLSYLPFGERGEAAGADFGRVAGEFGVIAEEVHDAKAHDIERCNNDAGYGSEAKAILERLHQNLAILDVNCEGTDVSFLEEDENCRAPMNGRVILSHETVGDAFGVHSLLRLAVFHIFLHRRSLLRGGHIGVLQLDKSIYHANPRYRLNVLVVDTQHVEEEVMHPEQPPYITNIGHCA